MNKNPKLRKRRWWEPEPVTQADPELEALYERHAGEGLSDDPSDRALPVSDEAAGSPELRAVFEADRTGDPLPVIEYLGKHGLPWIADYVYRQLVRKRTPNYEYSAADFQLYLASSEVSRLMEAENLSLTSAIEKVALEKFPKDEEMRHDFRNALAGYRSGRRASTRRQRRRRPALKR
jgi:hypothetical protein